MARKKQESGDVDSRMTPRERPEPRGEECPPGDVGPEELPEEEREQFRADADEKVSLRGQIEELNQKWRRALADFENYKKRVERERARWDEATAERIMLPLIEVLDNFERAIRVDSCDLKDGDGPFRQGIGLIFKHFAGVLERQGVRRIEAVGKQFDPNLHEAVCQVESEEHESNQIVEEIARGYILGDRLLRPSRVVVAK